MRNFKFAVKNTLLIVLHSVVATVFLFRLRYNGEVGDVVVGRITEVRNLQCYSFR